MLKTWSGSGTLYFAACPHDVGGIGFSAGTVVAAVAIPAITPVHASTPVTAVATRSLFCIFTKRMADLLSYPRVLRPDHMSTTVDLMVAVEARPCRRRRLHCHDKPALRWH